MNKPSDLSRQFLSTYVRKSMKKLIDRHDKEEFRDAANQFVESLQATIPEIISDIKISHPDDDPNYKLVREILEEPDPGHIITFKMLAPNPTIRFTFIISKDK